MTPQPTVKEISLETSIGEEKHLWTQIIQIRILGYTKKEKMDFRMEAVQIDFESWVRLVQMAKK